METNLDDGTQVHLQPTTISRQSSGSDMRSVGICVTLQLSALASQLGDLDDSLVRLVQRESVRLRRYGEKRLH